MAGRWHTQVLRSARAIQAEVQRHGLGEAGSANPLDLYETTVTDPVLRDTTRQLFQEAHYALAVEEAFKCLNNVVKARTGLKADGADLMRTTFSPKRPHLKLSDLKSQSKIDQQQGYMDIFAGAMTGIRNPRAHVHKYLDEPHAALELLSLANHLLRLVTGATRSRFKK